jgi:serine/threonine protein kinase/formylglycine-generating enzyme required for sulfatase activity
VFEYPSVPVSFDQFCADCETSGLLSADEVAGVRAGLGESTDPQQLARALVKGEKLTAFQAQQVYAGKGKALVLGNYVLLDKLGQGGMGAVYKASHRRMKRIVALKVLSPDLTKTEEAVSRFLREVEAAGRLQHPNIVTAFDADCVGKTHFLVMECVEGSDLSSLVKAKGPLAVDKAVHCVVQAAKGLEYAHSQGIVHRDIKPANLLLDKGGVVKILDMGLARFSGEGRGELTGDGAMMGTVDYMSPEQALDTRNADERADIYSLGATLWYLLTGRPLYEGESMMAKLLAHQQQPIPSLKVACAAAPASLDSVFQKMVAKKPGDRWQSMTDTLAALGQAFIPGASTPSLLSVHSETSRLDLAFDELNRAVAYPSVENRPTSCGEGWRGERRRPGGGSRPASPSLRNIAMGAVAVTILALGWISRPDPSQSIADPVSAQQPLAPAERTPPVERPLAPSTVPVRDSGHEGGSRLVIDMGTVSLALRWCPPGAFDMGSPVNEVGRSTDEQQVRVTLTKGFWMAETETTQRLYAHVTGTNPSRHVGETRPVERVSWEDAEGFCKQLTTRERQSGRLSASGVYRLPTEAEWEYACRAETTSATAFGNQLSWRQAAFKDAPLVGEVGIRVNYDRPMEVGHFPPNKWGLRDLHGNVWEWCADVYRADRTGGADPLEEQGVREQGRVVRGGSWVDGASVVRSASRGKSVVGYAYYDLYGFRCVGVNIEPGH